MWDLSTVPWVRPGSEFYFSYATTIILPLGIETASLKGFRKALNTIPDSSLYLHFYEARKIKKVKEHDDFSIWIEENFKNKILVQKIRDIDFYFFSLEEIRKKLVKIFEEEADR